MYDNYNYPEGADTPDAPWNKVDNEEEEVEVTVSITLSKTFKISTDNYSKELEEDEDGRHVYTEYNNLEEDVKSQVVLPNESYKYIPGNTSKGKQAIEDLKDWIVDDFEVIEE